MDEQLTTRQVAEALSVSESSVKRWCNCGAIPTVRTVGGHRRIPMAALMQFLETTQREVRSPLFESRSLDANQPAAVSDGAAQCDQRANSTRDELREQFITAMEVGDENRARALLSAAYSAEESIALVADGYIAPAMQRMGERWSCSELEIYQERRACEICSRLLHELRRLIPEASPASPVALGGSPAGDYYTLPSQLIELVLRENGWRSMNLGSNLPLPTLLAAARKHQPRMVWLSVSHIASPQTFADEYQAFRQQLPAGTLIVVGGRALNDELRPQLEYTAHCDNLRQLACLATAVRDQFRQSQ